MMKNLFLLTALSFAMLFTSCGSDDDGATQDPIIGTWKITRSEKDGKEVALEKCEKKYEIIFETNNKVIDVYYETQQDDSCKLDKTTGTWVNNGDNKYTGSFIFDEDDKSIYEYELKNGEMVIKYEEKSGVTLDFYTKQ